jgi:hypothetical protein
MAPQQSGIYAGFDFQSPVAIRRFINALEYIFIGGMDLDHQTLRALGDTPEEIYARYQNIQMIVQSMRNNNAYRRQIDQLRATYYGLDTGLLAAAGALLAFPIAPTDVVAAPSAPSGGAPGPSALSGVITTASAMTGVTSLAMAAHGGTSLHTLQVSNLFCRICSVFPLPSHAIRTPRRESANF